MRIRRYFVGTIVDAKDTANEQKEATGLPKTLSSKKNDLSAVKMENGVYSISSSDDLQILKDYAAEEMRVLFIDFYATWCLPCKSISPYFEALSQKSDHLFAKVDVDECEAIATESWISVLPTFGVLMKREGKWTLVDKVSGAKKEALEALIMKYS